MLFLNKQMLSGDRQVPKQSEPNMSQNQVQNLNIQGNQQKEQYPPMNHMLRQMHICQDHSLNIELNLILPSMPPEQKEDLPEPEADAVQRVKTRARRKKTEKERKIRTLITKEKLLQMNKIFTEVLQKQSEKGVNPEVKHHGAYHWNLKNIAKHLNLGYSTILHKFRQFRAHKKVRAGALIASMQQKRKYKKSLLVQKLIKESMAEKEFFTASQMTNYIEEHYNQRFSRSIISRHLGQMGYSYKNVTKARANLNQENRFAKIKKMYVEVMRPLIDRGQTLIYIDEMSCCTNQVNEDQPKTISILMACTVYGVLFFHLQDGFIDRDKFHDIVKEFLVNLRESPLCSNIQGQNDQIFLVVDASSIHRDGERNSGLATMLIEENTQIYYIPPSTPEFNPLEPIFERIRGRLATKVKKAEIYDYMSLWEGLQSILEGIKSESTEECFVAVFEQMLQNLEATGKK